MGVKLHRNLSAGGIAAGRVWSIIGASGKVAGWCKAAAVQDGAFIFSESRYAAMQQRRTRYLVAWLRGDVTMVEGFVPSMNGVPSEIQALQGIEEPIARGGTPVAYRFSIEQPFSEAAFRTPDGARVDSATRVRLYPDGTCSIN